MNTHYYERWLKAASKDQANEPLEHCESGDDWRSPWFCTWRDAVDNGYDWVWRDVPNDNLPPDRRELYAGQTYDGNNTDFEVLGLTG